MDVAQGEWSAELLSATELDAGVFAPLVDSGDLVGSVTRDAAERTGLAM